MTTVVTRGAASAQALGYAARATAANYIEDVFSTYLYTGNGSAQTITNGIDLSTKGGMVWVKSRSATDHNVADTLRGVNKYLVTNNTDPSYDFGYQTVTAFNTNGFSVGNAGWVNTNSTNYASWTFRKQAKFFDVVTYTGDGVAGRTVSHSLGSVPGCIFVKRTDAAGAWHVYHRSLGGTKALFLNGTNAAVTNIRYWNDTDPTSTVFTLGFDSDVNASGGTYVAYLFAHDAGGFGASGTDNVISCGSYAGNGTGSGPIVTLGYEPQWIMVKDITDSVQDWVMQDVMRGMTVTAGEGLYLRANSSAADAANSYFTPFATGFQPNQASGQANASGRTYIYIAIRRGPMRTPTSGTSVFSPTTRTGTGSVTSITGVSFPPDMLLNLNRDGLSPQPYHSIFDKLRGSLNGLRTSLTNAESSFTGSVTSFDQGGISLGGNTLTNSNLYTYAPMLFRRAPGFFDVVCYTGTAIARTVNHNLGVVPEMMIVKNRSNPGSLSIGWYVYHSGLGGNTKFLQLNTTAAVADDGGGYWNSTTPTSTVFSLGASNNVNYNAGTFVNYLFATVAGVSKVGSYTGTGTTKQIDCGFTGGARFVLIKRTDSTGDWYVWDSARGIVAGNDPYLLLNSDAGEVTNTDYVDTYSAGFEISSTAPAAINANGGTFIFLAIA